MQTNRYKAVKKKLTKNMPAAIIAIVNDLFGLCEKWFFFFNWRIKC